MTYLVEFITTGRFFCFTGADLSYSKRKWRQGATSLGSGSEESSTDKTPRGDFLINTHSWNARVNPSYKT